MYIIILRFSCDFWFAWCWHPIMTWHLTPSIILIFRILNSAQSIFNREISIESKLIFSDSNAIYELLDAVIQWWIETKGLSSFWDFELAIQLNLYSIEKCLLSLHYHSEIQFRFLICLMLTLNASLTPHIKYHAEIPNSQFRSIYMQ